MRWTLVLVTGCWTSAPNAPARPPVIEPESTCMSLTAETLRNRDLLPMKQAEGAPITKESPLRAVAMSGPYWNVAAACEDCERGDGSGRYLEIATGGRKLAIRIGNKWWSTMLAINDTCALHFEPVVARDLVAPAPGDELFLQVTQDCAEPQDPFQEPDFQEHIVMCGVGRSQRPSCVEADFGVTGITPEWSEHTRLDLACDGIATFTGWHGEDGEGFTSVHTRRQLVFP
ncbi:MAG TPA: hypothetical protein VMZ53_21505 [Kofleriaceae bacterium]|nr:hypothetical protein [Kofleriaceae bacterium]